MPRKGVVEVEIPVSVARVAKRRVKALVKHFYGAGLTREKATELAVCAYLQGVKDGVGSALAEIAQVRMLRMEEKH